MNPFTSESQRYEYPLTPDDVVIDAGCYEGAWSEEISRRYGCTIWALEPVPAFRGRCIARLANRPKVTVLEWALFNQNGPLKMGISNDSSGVRSHGQSIEVQARTLAHILEGLSIPRVNLLKLNIESAEFPVLADILESGLMPRIDRLQVQWHGIENFQSEYHRIRERILQTHDHIWGENPLLWESYEIKR